MQTPIRTETDFLGLAPPRGIATLCIGHCSTCVARDVRTMRTLTSSPPSSRISRAVSPECPALPDGNRRRGLRSLRDLTQHLTTRADDSHAAPVHRPRREDMFPYLSSACQTPVRFFALRRIEPHAPPLVRGPVNSFEFQPCDRTPQAGYLMR